MKKAIFLSMALLLAVGTLMAQNGKGQGPPAGMGQGSGSASSTASGTGQSQAGKKELVTVTIAGTVTAVNLHDLELEFPSIIVDGTIDGVDADPVEVKLAPYWFLLDNDIEVAVDDVVSIVAFLGTPNATAYYAISIDGVTLRTDDGSPLWTGGHGSTSVVRSVGMRKCSAKNNCIVSDSISVIEGTVESIRYGKGIQHLTLLVKVDMGILLEFKLGPADYLLANGLELEQGDGVMIRYALTQRTNTWLVLQIGKAGGVMVTLRDDNGDPAWR